MTAGGSLHGRWVRLDQTAALRASGDSGAAGHIALRIGRNGMVCTNGSRKKEQLPREIGVKQGFFLVQKLDIFQLLGYFEVG